jgi:abhydrolase domain-containing protein 17
MHRVPTYISDTFHKPKSTKDYPVHDLKLIDRRRNVIDVDNPEDLRIDCYYIQTYKNETIPVAFIQPVEFIDYVLIYSHPNSTDIGLMLDNYLDLSYNLKINVLGYDYTGYGQSTGKASDENAIYDIEAVYEFATKQLGFTWEKIILYGQSIGSGPSVTLVTSTSIQRQPIIDSQWLDSLSTLE